MLLVVLWTRLIACIITRFSPRTLCVNPEACKGPTDFLFSHRLCATPREGHTSYISCDRDVRFTTYEEADHGYSSFGSAGTIES
ncbi:hypothetical protein VN97_g2048 [Penicillium thymicola]|uniref:Secreted protein n=1 Tax=Penicillium thymicola TaxID=293382 RepID=A0AAI9XBT7_PENTH|nr:hypothetical protein VN97_g2048 [Penicillium thymicola]